MSRAKQAFLGCVGSAVLIGAGVACSAEAGGLFDNGERAGGADSGASGADSPSASGVGASARGVVLVHAASFPSFRLCFQNMPLQVPVPDTRILPESNVVGVETGGFVRLPPMEAPGNVYVVDERVLRNRTETCGQLIGGILHKGNDFDVIAADDDAGTALLAPLGQSGVDVIALSGCASTSTLANLGVAEAACGPTYSARDGSLVATVARLQPSTAGVTSSSLPVRLYQLSTAVDALAAKGALTVSFGELEAGTDPLAQQLPTAPLFQAGPQTTIALDRSNESVYGTHGFRIAVGAVESPVVLDQSLATVQALSSSNDLPSSYYGTASSYALLLLGDPTYPADAGAASTHLGMHLLAVPVLDPAAADAGTDASADAAP